jgi:cytoskeletal protein CcmA (bactofilin family)
MADKETIIGSETRVSGEIRGDENVVVRGRVEGRVVLNAVFTVEESAVIQADIEARVVLVSGVIVGNVVALESIRLADRARVVGDITAPRVIMEEGATYKGRLDMGSAAEASDAQARSAARRSQDSSAGRSSPPRLSVPSRVVAEPDAVTARVAPPAPDDDGPRVAPAAPPRLPGPIPVVPPAEAPPSLPAPEAVAEGGVASAPSWAKKKLHRRP